MKSYRKKYNNILEKKNHLTVVSRAHNTIESLENQAQDAFIVERTPPQYYMQRMGQLYIQSLGRGRYNLKYYQKQDRLTFPPKRKLFKPEVENQESFILLSKRKKKNVIQIPTFFRIYPTIKKFEDFKEVKSDRITFKKTRRCFELQNENNFLIERKKKLDYFIESINDIKIKSEGKFFNNKPVLKKKSNLEVEYLVIKAPFKPVNETNVFFEQQDKKTVYKNKINMENKFDICYNMNKPKIFSPEQISISANNNIYIPTKKITSFKEITIDNPTNVTLNKIFKEKSFNQMTIDDQPDLFIQECPAKRYVSVGMEKMTFIGNLRPEYCLEIDPNEEIHIPNVYDMLLLQNYWDDLEIKHFGICLRPIGYRSNKKLAFTNEIIKERKESKDSKDSKDSKESKESKMSKDSKDKENKDGEEKKNEENNARRISMKDVNEDKKSKDSKDSKDSKKKKFKRNDLKKTFFGKK